VDGQAFPHHAGRIQLNHYICRSGEDIEEKLRRKAGGAGRPYLRERFDQVNQSSCVEDRVIIDTVAASLARLGLIAAGQVVPDGHLLGLMHQAAGLALPAPPPPVKTGRVRRRNAVVSFISIKTALQEAVEGKDTAAAVEASKKLIRLFPSHLSFHSSLAGYCLGRGDLEGALDALSAALELAADSLPAARALADYYYLTDQVGKAEEILRWLLTRDPDEPQVLFKLSKAVLSQSRAGEGIELCWRALQLDQPPYSLEAGQVREMIHNISEFLRKNGNQRGAAAFLEAGLRRFPEDEGLQAAVAECRAADAVS
jgi:tetratricopeptide (TPR) repeat protein